MGTGFGLLRQILPLHGTNEAFDDYKYVNMDIDIHTKRIALKASASVVALVSLKGNIAYPPYLLCKSYTNETFDLLCCCCRWGNHIYGLWDHN